MDALLLGFVTTLLAEIGGRVQHACAASAPDASRVTIFTALVFIIIGGAAIGGLAVAPMLNRDAGLLMLGIALISGGIGQCARIKPVTGSLGSMAVAIAVAPAPFMAFAITARSASPMLTASGTIAGMLFVGLPALLLREEWDRPALFARLRWIAAAILLAAGTWCALSALRFI